MESALVATYAEIIAQELAETPEAVQREVLNFLLYLKHGAATVAPTAKEVVPQEGVLPDPISREPFPGLALSEAVFGRYWNDPIEDEAWKDL